MAPQNSKCGARLQAAPLALDFEGHGIGKVLVPLVVRRQAPTELGESLEKLKSLLESAEPAG